VQAFLFDGYWEDIGTIEAFYNANMGITKKPIPDFRWAMQPLEIFFIGSVSTEIEHNSSFFISIGQFFVSL